ncbi:hypothetical protein BKP37_10195 [Anaerobacillus alkalilacustris]|uniref:Uncharacterized protein n=1 Tax=Anaerobacillus alkalilacustris TaxID=393763 RepID=A0A1S2LM92_9BACI|nr:hypothetical protein [Anaerobacillus alkalilacustris]OIJ13639.1 hypothetical protein BKP37_10195 [Anaerobacillus alkalilacustris]
MADTVILYDLWWNPSVEESVNVVINSSENTNNLLESMTSIAGEVNQNQEIVNELNNHVNKFKKVEGKE